MKRNLWVIKLIKKYQKNKAIIGVGHCRFYPTCSNYAMEAYEKFSFFYASLLTLWRILRCNPFTKRKYDPVPLSKQEKKQKQLLEELRQKENGELIDILIKEFSIHPEAKGCDYQKLLYQSYYGPNHLLHTTEVERIKAYLEKELKEISQNKQTHFQAIGNGYYRIPLSIIDENISIDSFLSAFRASCQNKSIPSYSFASTFELLNLLIKTKQLPLITNNPITIPEEAPHHSSAYREAYEPHYRLIHRNHIPFSFYLSKIKQDIEEILNAKPFVLIGIDGPAGSGKSLFAKRLKKELQAEIIHMDDFFLPNTLKTKKRLKQVGGNIHYERIIQEIIAPLQTGFLNSYQRLDCNTQTLHETKLSQTRVYLLEGVYSTHPAFSTSLDYIIYLDIDKPTQLKRLAMRSPHLLEKFKNEWLPLEEKYFKAFQVKNFANLIVWGEYEDK